MIAASYKRQRWIAVAAIHLFHDTALAMAHTNPRRVRRRLGNDLPHALIPKIPDPELKLR
eukprot:4577471-Amphidinium_carterae.2